MGNLMCITSAIDKSWREKQKTWIENGVNVLKPPSSMSSGHGKMKTQKQAVRQRFPECTTEKDEWICKIKRS